MQLKNKLRSHLWLPLLAIAPAFSSCDKYLAEPPSKSTTLVVTTTAQLDALLNTYTSFYTEGNRTAIYGTDDFGITTDLYNARPGTFTLAAFQFGLWDIPYLPDDTRESFWSNEWRKIFTANLVLSKVGEVSGTDAEKTYLTADAHFVRAYSYWVLANTYCLPYTEANKKELGLPLKMGTSFEESAARGTLEDTYKLIEADLAEALKVSLPLVQNNKARHWRANKAGVNGFAARYYLNRNNYTQALKYANDALADYSQLVDYNTGMRYGNDQAINIDAGTPQAKTVTLKYPYTHDNQVVLTDMLEWKEFLYFRMLTHESWWYVPSQELLNLYDKAHDLRYQYHIVEDYSYDRGMIKPSYSYPGYVFFFKDRIPSGPTVAEMLLIKAECLARTSNFNDALTVVNTLRAKRITAGAWVDLTAANQADAIKKILEERRREMPFAHRWFDIRRYNNNEDATDDVTLTKTFYPYNNSAVLATEPVKTYTLSKNSRRFAVPLPRTELISSNGVIVQNTY
jgi:hypothetical protein